MPSVASQPERAAQTIEQLRQVTDRPINANFFCHVPARNDTQREQAWRERLSRYYGELGIDPDLQRPHVDIAPFGAEMCVSIAKPYNMRTLTRLCFRIFSPADPRESWRVV